MISNLCTMTVEIWGLGELVVVPAFKLASFIIPFYIAEGYIAKRCLKYLQFSSFLPDEYFNPFSTANKSEIEHMISATWSILSSQLFFQGVKFVGQYPPGRDSP